MLNVRNFTNSIKGVFIGVILFIAALVVIFWNEGRLDYSELASTATEINADTVSQDQTLQDKLVSATGKLTTTGTISDDLFLNAQDYIALERTVEAYAWVEQEEEQGNTNIKVYSYKQEWVEEVPNSKKFDEPIGHENKEKTIANASAKNTATFLGAYSLNIENVTLPNLTPLSLNEEKVTLKDDAILASDKYIYLGQGNINNPQIGDMRISYSVLENNQTATIFGKLKGQQITSYTDKKNHLLYRLFIGDRESAIATMHTEYVVSLWGLRALGFILMWIGIGLILGPFSAVLRFIPLIGGRLQGVGQALISFVTFFVALIISAAFILLSIILHSVVAMAIVSAVIVVGIVIAIILSRKKKQPQIV
jgi:hypothetical protein